MEHELPKHINSKTILNKSIEHQMQLVKYIIHLTNPTEYQCAYVAKQMYINNYSYLAGTQSKV